jgi:hypothetical protein
VKLFGLRVAMIVSWGVCRLCERLVSYGMESRRVMEGGFGRLRMDVIW